MRLNRFLAAAGVGSRRGCDELIREGRVQVNGETVGLPGPEIDPEADEVRVDGERVRPPRHHVYLMMNKPAGYVTTRADEHARRTVDDLLGPYRGRVFSVGRLDRASEGLLLFTNDGDLANHLLHPRYRQERVYLAWVRPFPNLEVQRRIEEGVSLGPGERSGPAKVRVLGQKGDAARVRITLREGKNREVRRIFASQGMQVLALRRTVFAGLFLGGLVPGSVRSLTEDELEELRRRTGLPLTPGAGDVREGKAIRSEETARETARPGKTSRAGRTSGPDRTSRSGRAARPGATARFGKAVRPGRTARSGKAAGAGRTVRPGRTARPGEPPRPGKPIRLQKPPRPGGPRPGKPGRAGGPARSGKPVRPRKSPPAH